MKIGLVSTYPPSGMKHAAGQGGVSSYTANLLSALPTDDLHYVVYANKLAGHPSSSRISDCIEIIRCWTPGIFSVFHIVGQIAKSRPDLIHVQHEVFLFGKGTSVILPTLLLMILKAMRIPVIVTSHGVPPLSKVTNSFIESYNLRISSSLVKMVLWLVVWPVMALADRVVVLGENFAQILVKEYLLARKKMVVIPHGIELRDDRVDPEEAKARLGLTNKLVILFFGNLTGYKGLEILIDSMGHLEKLHNNLILVIAGGETPGLKVAGEQGYSERLKQRAQGVSPNIHFTGFVEEKDIALYFGAADLLVLPYTIVMSSGGPLALAVTYECPFIVSTALASVVDQDAAIFEPTVQSLVEKVHQFIEDDDLRQMVKDYVLMLKAERGWPQVGKQFERLYRKFLRSRR